MARRVSRPGVRDGYYLNRIADAGFGDVGWREYPADAVLASEIEGAAKYIDRPLLLLIEARRPERR